jgi:hypothetical protein
MAEFTRAFFLREAFEHLLGEHPIVRVVFMDHPELMVPDVVKPGAGQTTTFEYGLNLPVPIPDLEITDEGIRATLSFNRMPRRTFVPWEAVIQVGLPMPKSIETIGRPASTKPKPSLKLVP